MKTVIAGLVGFVALAALAGQALAQDGCKDSRSSCSQLNASCEKACQGGNNPSACIARTCSIALTGCKANGVWKSVVSPACWKTNIRS
jgi:hypothetical protein